MRIIGVFLILLLTGCGTEKTDEGTSKQTDELVFDEITTEEVSPEGGELGTAAFMAEDVQQFEEIQALYGVDVRDVDFSEKNVLFLSFITDGCGLVLEDLYIEGGILHVELELPEEYRGQDSIACTTIAKPTTIILETSKMDITDALFVRSGEQVEVNELLKQEK